MDDRICIDVAEVALLRLDWKADYLPTRRGYGAGLVQAKNNWSLKLIEIIRIIGLLKLKGTQK